MSSSSRELRPFDDFEALDDLLGGLVLQVGDTRVESDDRIVLEEDEYRRVPVSIRFPYEEEGLRATLEDVRSELESRDLRIDDLVISVNLYSSYLKISDFPFLFPLSELAIRGPILDLTPRGERPRALRAPRSGCRVEVAVLLAEQHPPSLGRPWRKGTWLSRATFAISCEIEFSGFTPRPMDAETKSNLRLPPNATRFVVVPPGIDPLVDEASPDLIEMWVDADLLAIMSSRDRSKGSVAIQKQLFVDAFEAVVSEVRGRPDFADKTWSDISESMFGKMLRAIAGRSKGEREDEVRDRCEALLAVLREDRARFMAHVESFADVTPSFKDAAGE